LSQRRIFLELHSTNLIAGPRNPRRQSGIDADAKALARNLINEMMKALKKQRMDLSKEFLVQCQLGWMEKSRQENW